MTPRFTIILPSYNGGAYLKLAVASVLQQSFTDFELAILEDASTDDSLEWLRSLDDPRVKLFPAPQNLGIENNWRRALEIPKGEFMTFWGQDDLMDSNYLEVMNALICREADASLYFAHFRYIDKDGQLVRHCRALPARETAAEYIAALFCNARDTWGTGYMMRSDLHDKVGGIPPFKGLLFADDTLWIKTMHYSWKATASEECFSCREHDASAGKNGGLSWIEGMRSYITFLEELSKNDEAVAQAYHEYGPSYFDGYCFTVFMDGIVKAINCQQRFEPRLQKELFAQLARVSPALARTMRRNKRVRLYRMVNSNFVLRELYKRYIYLRTGREFRG